MSADEDAMEILWLKAEIAAARVLVAGWRVQLLLRYNPDWDRQPRRAAGNPEGGQWPTEGGGGNAAGGGTAGEATPTRIAQDTDSRRYSINLLEEEAPIGVGHTIRKHVGKSDVELLQAIEANTYRGFVVSAIDYREGSFASLESANDLTNRVLQENKAIVDLVASGFEDELFVKERFGIVTGREAIPSGCGR